MPQEVKGQLGMEQRTSSPRVMSTFDPALMLQKSSGCWDLNTQRHVEADDMEQQKACHVRPR